MRATGGMHLRVSQDAPVKCWRHDIIFGSKQRSDTLDWMDDHCSDKTCRVVKIEIDVAFGMIQLFLEEFGASLFAAPSEVPSICSWIWKVDL
jgi:hypothetical protein